MSECKIYHPIKLGFYTLSFKTESLKSVKNEGMQRKGGETITWASMRACQDHASVKEETPPINLLVVDSNALLTRLQFYLGSWQLEAEGLYSRDSGIMNSAGPSISFWTLFPLIWDHGVRNPHFHRIPRFPGRRERFHLVMFSKYRLSGFSGFFLHYFSVGKIVKLFCERIALTTRWAEGVELR